MTGWAVWLAILAAISGAPLRQAEAARDLALSFAELADPNVIEPQDGGVGDDAGEATVKCAAASCEPAAKLCLDQPFGWTDRLHPPSHAQLRSTERPRPELCQASRPDRRRAWLQVFLF